MTPDIQEASNTVRIHAAHGRSRELGEYLNTVVSNLLRLPGCQHSSLSQDATDNDVWVISVQWVSCQAMAEHFAQPSNENLNGLLSNRFVRQVTFESDIERCSLPTPT
ncbi:Antibiotic biosynthesis monooxygenase [Pseudomonas sp. NFACC02]|uniref:putative quinol monooxygenase n=1 Tax=Pseudomonas sp. NFACC02 TaxID=1566250 RepID=UPI0008BC27FB|nr:antibiotic biosynthesis monooxygenase family protein [Pseudomonas sp. NFACC02]SEQ23967.1 Antibiotic biosynthesis monooxygenase [Pseudomonas sp. NFACC02]